MRLAHLGPRGTYTEAAAIAYDPSAELITVPTFTASVEAVERGDADAAICAIENSLEGGINETLDLLLREDATILVRGEVVLPIRHALVGVDGLIPADARVVYSHPQALAQCRRQ